MTAAGKGLLTVLSEELTPMVKRTVGNPQIAGNLGQRFVAGFHQLNRFQFELFRKRSLSLLHGLFPSWRMSTSSSLPSPLSRVKTRPVHPPVKDATYQQCGDGSHPSLHCEGQGKCPNGDQQDHRSCLQQKDQDGRGLAAEAPTPATPTTATTMPPMQVRVPSTPMIPIAA